MITKAIVEGIVPPNKFKVRIPIFNGVVGARQFTAFEELPVATLCTTPGFENVLSVGDVVFVAFEDNDVSTPIILGCLYTNESGKKASVDINARSLDVTGDKASSVILPENTSLGGVSSSTLKELIMWANNHDSR